MAFGVFIHRADSIYKDRPAEHYRFPSQYLGRVEACLGSWIIYYSPVKVSESRGYFAIAKVQQIVRDPETSDMYLALIEPGTYLDFADPVPFRRLEGVVELGLLNALGKISGRAQSAVRPISASDFNRILALGFSDSDPLLPRVDDAFNSTGFAEDQAPFDFEQQRDRISYVNSRIVRDRVFRRIVLRAYDERCAITGLRLINGGGRAEVEAAHIRPVEANGPDSVTNGIALSGTAHWMFDRGLISLTDEFEVLVSRQANDQDAVRAFINKSGRALVPRQVLQRPHPQFLNWHRENCFKQ
ncbi:HNH endonuclease [Rhizobium sp. HT1-10]|uniref:HNH endonuclease n=1 Tax=Rhizobium sp. HT1-10 TaxID=3111638 RepID=UPI003C1FE864